MRRINTEVFVSLRERVTYRDATHLLALVKIVKKTYLPLEVV